MAWPERPPRGSRRGGARPARLRRIVPLSHFARDLAAGVLPDFSLVVPDLCHDMHDCPVATGDAWHTRIQAADRIVNRELGPVDASMQVNVVAEGSLMALARRLSAEAGGAGARGQGVRCRP